MFALRGNKVKNSLACAVLKRYFAEEAVKEAALTISSSTQTETKRSHRQSTSLASYRHIYPEFLPDPNPKMRNLIREKLERLDMLARRTQIDIPEFYVGSIVAITSSDPHSPGKTHRFVGICLDKEGCGLRARFTLRNVIDHQGIEIEYDMYDPTLCKIEVLRLEKRLDDQLFYLRDALPEYSTFDPNMDIELVPEGDPVPINPIKVKLRPRPWLEKWERKNLKGIEGFDLPENILKRAEELATPWAKYDLMKEYMKTIPEEEQSEIFADIQSQLQQLEVTRKRLKRKRIFVKPVKLA